MKKYELVDILKPDMEEEARESLITRIDDVIKSDGEILEKDVWGLKKMAYPIQKKNEGYYVLVNFQSNPEHQKEIIRNLNLFEAVVRQMIIAVD